MKTSFHYNDYDFPEQFPHWLTKYVYNDDFSRKHGLYGWRCVHCGRVYGRHARPVHNCFGILTFTSWDAAAKAGCLTKSQWSAGGFRVIEGCLPTAYYFVKSGVHVYSLFSFKQVVPKRSRIKSRV